MNKTEKLNAIAVILDQLRLGGQVEFYNRYMALTDEERNKLPYGYGDMENAFQHAYTAAKIAKYAGEIIAREMGYIKERTSKIYEIYSNGKTNAFLDTNRDLWNNDMGIKYIKEAKARGEHLSNKQIGDYIFNEIIKEKSDFIVNFQIDNRRWDDSANEDNLWEKIREKQIFDPDKMSSTKILVGKLKSVIIEDLTTAIKILKKLKDNKLNETGKNNPELQSNKNSNSELRKYNPKDVKFPNYKIQPKFKKSLTGKAAPIVEEEESNLHENRDLSKSDLKIQNEEIQKSENFDTIKNDKPNTIPETSEILADVKKESKSNEEKIKPENLDIKADEDTDYEISPKENEFQNENNVKSIENRAQKEENAQSFHADPYEKYRKMGWKVIEEKTRSEISKDGVGFAYFNRGKVEIMTEDEIYERLFGRFIDEFKEAAKNRGYVYKRFWKKEE